MVLENDGICLEYYVLKVSCNLLLNIWFIPFCHLDLYSGSPQKLQDYCITTTTYVGEQNIQISCRVDPCEYPKIMALENSPKSCSFLRLNFLSKRHWWHNRVTHKNHPGKQLVHPAHIWQSIE